MGVDNMKKAKRIVGNTLIEEYGINLNKEANETRQILGYADKIAHTEGFHVDYIRLEEVQMYSADRGIPVFTDINSLNIVMDDLVNDSIRSCMIKGFYQEIDLTVILDFSTKTIRFNRNRFTNINLDNLVNQLYA